MPSFLPEASLLIRARSLARSNLRLIRALELSGLPVDGTEGTPIHQLQRFLEFMLGLIELLDVGQSTPDVMDPELAELLDQHALEQKRLHQELLASLPADQRQAVRTRLLQVSISDRDLAIRRQRMQPLATRERTRRRRCNAPHTEPIENNKQISRFHQPSTIEAGLLADLMSEVGPDLSEKELQEVGELLQPLLGMLDPDAILADLEQSWRKEQEDRSLPLDVDVVRALRSLPSHWIQAIHQRLGLPAARRKEDRIAAISQLLMEPSSLQRVVAKLPKRESEALRHLLQAGGWQRTGTFCRKFGADHEDGWFWLDSKPKSLLGRLRLRGLVFVGRSRIDGRRYRVAVIAQPLRPLLAAALGIMVGKPDEPPSAL